MVISMRHNPQPQEIYRHFKGNLYQIRCLAKHSETGEMMVVYQAMYGNFQIYVRPLSSFMEEVDRRKYPNVTARYRFELQGEDLPGGDTPKPVSVPETPAHTGYDAYAQTQEELNIDPLVLQFLDADSYERRLEILSMLHSRIDHNMINTMAVAVDVEIKEGDIESRYEELKNCLLTFEKYECNRLRP
ncbi:MAG: DUF1653 domain-containing protein [Roseburia sp.]|nr:DUF1653 domain-containing protein [Ruminococcus sp.]MCM1156013.1 DUF1653 domain-containing protein [Roseburia sp.]MCM1242388.1 DUF1653 domain-containing protein [Roseburia sp.]